MKNLIFHSIKEGTTQLWRNKFLSITTILLGALIVFLLNFVFTIAYYTDLSLKDLESRADFNIPLSSDIDDLNFQYGALKNELTQNYDLSLKRLEKQDYPQFSVPARLNIRFNDLESVAPVFETIKKTRYAELLGNWNGSSERDFVGLVGKLLQLRNGIDQAAFWLVIIFMVGGVLITINAFRIVLFSRREEIRIARLVGADTSFIAGPFFWEAWLMGMLASFFGILVFVFVLREMTFLENAQFIRESTRANIFGYLWNHEFSYEIFGSALVSVLGAWLALRKYISGSFAD